jgi:Arylsulfotransferase (ASST)
VAALLALELATASTSAATGAPICVPSTLNNSALLDGSVTVSPLPGSRDSTPDTQISFLGVPAAKLSAVSVSGSRTGPHAGSLEPYSQGDGASFVPSRPFAAGETVTVRALLHSGRSTRPLLDRFGIANEDPLSSTPEPLHPGSPGEVQSFRSRPDLSPPELTVTTGLPAATPDPPGATPGPLAATPGDIFAAPYDGPGQSGPMIVEPDGNLVWFKPLPPHISATNLAVQAYRGRPVLTWWQGDITIHGFGEGEDVIANSSYQEIARVRAGNGLQADLHDFQLTPAGTALITAYDPIHCNLATVGGPSDGALTDATMQEIDVKTGLVMFQWTSLDHVPLSASYELARHSTLNKPFDFFHLNSIDLLGDGDLLVSARNTWASYALDPGTGQIQWQLGGKRSSFAMGPGTATAWQHDPRELPNGTFSIFDNGASPPIHKQSRVIVVSLDLPEHTATLVSQLTRPAPLLAESQGDAQLLPDGNWLVGWGQIPDFSELSPSGQLLLDAHFPAGDQSYRDLSFEWTGIPGRPPAFAVEPAGAGASTVYASWNGATQVSSWRVLAGASPSSLTPVAQAPRSGFETAIPLPAGIAAQYMAVQALGGAGEVLRSSATESEPASG